MEVRPARADEKEALARLLVRSRNGMGYVPPVPEEHVPLIADDLFSRHEDIWLAEEGRFPRHPALENRRQKYTGAIRFYERHGFRLVKLTNGAGNMSTSPTRSTSGLPVPHKILAYRSLPPYSVDLVSWPCSLARRW